MKGRSPLLLDEVLVRFFGASAVMLATGMVGFVATLVVARSYGAAGLGQLSIALALVEQGIILTTSGLHMYALHRSAAGIDQASRALVETTILRLVGALLVWPMLLLIVTILPGLEEAFALVAVLGAALVAQAVTPLWFPQARHETMHYVLVLLAVQLVNLLVLLLAVAVNLGLWAVGVARVTGEFVAACWLLPWTKARLSTPLPPWADLALLQVLRRTMPITGAQLLRGMTIGADPVLVALFVTETMVGYFGAAHRVFLLACVMVNTYLVIVMPRLAEQAPRGAWALRLELRNSLRRILPFAVLGALVLALTADRALPLLFGDGFEAASSTLALLGLATIFNLVNRHFRQVLLVIERQMTDLRWTAIAAACHLGSKLALVPLLGIEGAALGAVLGELFLTLALFLAMRSALLSYRPE